MEKKRKDNVRNTGIRLDDLLTEHTEQEQEQESTKPKPDKLKVRVDILKARAVAEKVPWPSDLEEQLRACKTAGAVRRLWRTHRIKHGA